MLIPEPFLHTLRYSLFALGTLTILHGLYVSLIRKWLLQRLGRENVGHVSPYGCIGQVFVLAGAVLLRDECPVCFWSAIIIALADPAGLHVLAGVMVYQGVQGWKSRAAPDPMAGLLWYNAFFVNDRTGIVSVSNVRAADDEAAIAQARVLLDKQPEKSEAVILFQGARLVRSLDRLPNATGEPPSTLQ